MALNPIPHPKINEVWLIEKQDLFPISWLHEQEFCEYQIFLNYFEGTEVEPTEAMIIGKLEHEQLELEFKKRSIDLTFPVILETSKKEALHSREFKVSSLKYGLYGKIDEVIFEPNMFSIIDDKPGKKAYDSDIHQVYGYSIAFKELVPDYDNRKIIAALRTRGTDSIYWKKEFSKNSENEIISVINRIHNLIAGNESFNSNKNPNKCRPCRFREKCDRSVI